MKKVFLSSIVLGLMFSCKPKTIEPTQPVISYDFVTTSDSSYVNKDEPTESDIEKRYWSSSETGLPIGVVTKTDCENCNLENVKKNLKNNYVTIKRPNETLTIKKDIDEDLFLNIEVGDVIQ